MVGSESVNAMTRKRCCRCQFTPFTISHTKRDAVDGLPQINLPDVGARVLVE